jgi:hypothetical protein
MRNWRNYQGREVVVHASGVTYRGVMVEMTETSILLRAETGHREVPMESITLVELKEESAAGGISSPSPLAGMPRK